MNQIVVLGGGAAGIVAAIAAAEQVKGVKVLLLEQNPRVGKKLLATGNGRCNLDHVPVSLAQYTTANPSIAAKLLDTISKNDPLVWVQQHGLMTRTDAEGRVYPYSNQASDFLNLLLYWLEYYRIEVHTECKVKTLAQKGREYLITTESGEHFYGQAVICAFGGKAGPQFGTNGFGSRLAKECGLHIEKEYPCLVPLRCEKSQIAGLSGIRVKAVASLYDGKQLIVQENGEIQLTEQGISGIAVMQLSNHMNHPHANYHISLNLFPQIDKQALFVLLKDRVRLFYRSNCADLMTGLIHRRIGMAVCKASGIDCNRSASSLSEQEINCLVDTFTNWTFDGLQPLEWKQAQTTGGGLSLDQIDGDSFALIGCPGLYFVGEMLDCVGKCGGYNLHFAFGSGIVAGRHAAKLMCKNKNRLKK